MIRLGIALLVLGVGHARADTDCTYLEIGATKSSDKAAAIDAELQPLEKKLTRPPFSGWNTFHKLSGGPAPLATNKPRTLKLQRGAATLLLRDRKDNRLELTITVDDEQGKRVLDIKQSINAADWNMWGHNVKDDGHILALTCR
jgi:hypothetical protein